MPESVRFEPNTPVRPLFKFDVEVRLSAESTLTVEAPDEESARKLVEGLEAEASFNFPPPTVDDSLWDWGAEISVTGCSLAEEQDV